MPPPDPDRRGRKRRATRQKISDVATRLFIKRGFDNVTVDEIAQAADVSRMTVFNHFARKEDMFFDLDDEAREDLITALEHRDPGTSPIEAVRLFAHWAIAEQRPYVQFSAPGTDKFLQAVQASEPLKARARAIRDELTDVLATALAKTAKRKEPDLPATLAASLLVAAWVVASHEAHRTYTKTKNLKKTNAAFLNTIDRSARATQQAVQDAPYA